MMDKLTFKRINNKNQILIDAIHTTILFWVFIDRLRMYEGNFIGFSYAMIKALLILYVLYYINTRLNYSIWRYNKNKRLTTITNKQ